MFRSSSDTEVILAAYLKWGIDCVNRFNGMFAIAIFDRETDELFLVRDRIGKKPLYYWVKGDEIVFGSELKPIVKYPDVELEINKEILPRFLFSKYINSPDSVFRNIYKLEPGGILKFRRGKIEKNKYWDVAGIHAELAQKPITSYEEAKAGLKTRIQEAVRTRLVSSDVPVGTFLSGGYDSTVVTAMAQAVSETPVKTFTIGFYDEKHNEAEYAKAISDYLHTDHTELYIAEKDLSELVRSIPIYYDEPFADASQIPTMLVSKLSRERVTVALSGDGGDEFYCGYVTYSRAAQAQKLDAVGGIVHGLLSPFHMEGKLPVNVQAISRNRIKECKTQLYSNKYWELISSITGATNPVSMLYPFESRYQESDWQTRAMLLDMDTYLPGDILCKIDRASMRYSLEDRCPLLDKEVMEFSYRIPQKYKYKDGSGKHIFKDIAYDYVPKELLDRPKKGFTVPLEKWLKEEFRDELIDYSNESFLRKQNLFNADEVTKGLKNYLENDDSADGSGAKYTGIWWAYFVFQQWYSNYMK